MVGAFLVAFWVLVAIFAPLISPYGPNANDMDALIDPTPNPVHWLGTDMQGRDILSRVVWGSRTVLTVAPVAVGVAYAIGSMLGLLAGYYRGFVDDLIMRLVDIQMGFPSLLTALIVLYVVGAGVWAVIFVLAVTRWMVYARVTRSLVFTYREEVFVDAARALGCPDRRIMFRHIMPNLLSPVLVLGTLEVATMILTEASLSFLGLGIQPPDFTWGAMVANGRGYLATAWWIAFWPGLAIMLTTLSLNILSNWARTVADPQQRWRLQKLRKSAR
jgi:peptide/nickel transport system permease protein